jgi:hypothetical protein
MIHQIDEKPRDDQSPAHVPGVCVTRRSLMNKMIAIPVAAAVSTIVPELAGSTPSQAPVIAAHPDADLLDLAHEYERLLAIETPLSNEKSRLWTFAVEELRWQILGVDPNDKDARQTIINERYDEFLQASNSADKDSGYNKAYRKFDRAMRNSIRVGRKILKLKPRTIDGLLVRARVIETHDEILRDQPLDCLLGEIREFAARVPSSAIAPSIGNAPIDPIFAAIEAHRKAWAAYKAGDAANISDEKSNALCRKECKAMDRIAETVPLTLNGLFAMLSYIGVVIEQQGDANLVFGDDATAVFTSMAKAAELLRKPANIALI